MYISYDKLTKQARCWVYITNKPMLSNRSLVKDHLKNLCDQWVSHGKNINSSFQLYKENFDLLVLGILIEVLIQLEIIFQI